MIAISFNVQEVKNGALSGRCQPSGWTPSVLLHRQSERIAQVNVYDHIPAFMLYNQGVLYAHVFFCIRMGAKICTDD